MARGTRCGNRTIVNNLFGDIEINRYAYIAKMLGFWRKTKLMNAVLNNIHEIKF